MCRCGDYVGEDRHGAILRSLNLNPEFDVQCLSLSMIALCLTGCQLNRPNYCGIGLSTGS